MKTIDYSQPQPMPKADLSDLWREDRGDEYDDWTQSEGVYATDEDEEGEPNAFWLDRSDDDGECNSLLGRECGRCERCC